MTNEERYSFLEELITPTTSPERWRELIQAVTEPKHLRVRLSVSGLSMRVCDLHTLSSRQPLVVLAPVHLCAHPPIAAAPHVSQILFAAYKGHEISRVVLSNNTDQIRTRLEAIEWERALLKQRLEARSLRALS